MVDIKFQVDKEKCVHCGKCVNDCIAKIIQMNQDNTPEISIYDENKCIKCQHCLAICPTGAISILGKNPQDSQPCDNFPQADQLLSLIKSRRSIRQYKNENLDTETMQKLKDMLKFVPTGCNHHSLHFAIIEDKDVMDRFRNRTNNKIKKMFLSAQKNNIVIKKFARYQKAFLDGEDVIFREAPHMVVVSTPINAPCANVDPIIALSYLELYAQSLGVGTLWCGFAQLCVKLFPDLAEFLEIPDGYKPVYVMLFGPTDTKYTRTIQPEEYKISTIKGNAEVDDIPIIKKLKRYFWNSIR